jgi:hypothetical protein
VSAALLVLLLLADQGPLPEGNALVKSLVGRQRQREEALDRYSYDVFEEKLELDGAGRVEQRHSRRYEVFFVKGRPVRLLVAEDGVPLAAKQRAKEEARSREKAEAIASGKVAREQPGMRLSRVMERYDFRTVAREEREGRSVLVLEFAPLPGKRELDSDNVLRALHGRLFVDETDAEVTRAEIRNSGGIKLRRGLGVSLGELDVVLDFQRLDDGVWLPRRVEATARGRVLWLKGFRQQTITSYSNFRRFGVETEEQVRP